jgi:hypothetical protein
MREKLNSNIKQKNESQTNKKLCVNFKNTFKNIPLVHIVQCVRTHCTILAEKYGFNCGWEDKPGHITFKKVLTPSFKIQCHCCMTTMQRVRRQEITRPQHQKALTFRCVEQRVSYILELTKSWLLIQ